MEYPKDTDGETNLLTKIRSSDGKWLGDITREDEEMACCFIEDCGGHALIVDWHDGHETMVCSAGLTMGTDGWWRISS